MNNSVPETMKAVLLTQPAQAEEIHLTDVPVPKVRPGWVLVKVRGFGLNHSEQILRKFEIENDYIQKPIIPGIECAGEVADPGVSALAVGQRVVSLMGGMGRSFHGSYAQYALLPVHHVFPVEGEMDWASLAAVPETYFTAWGSLFECLGLREGDTLLIRGATCALGYAAVQIAKALGCRVLATTHREEKLGLLADADEAFLDDGRLAGRVHGANKALDLVGPRSLRDTLLAVERGGIVCNTGVLGGVYALNGFDPIKDIPNGVYLTGFFSNSPARETMDSIFAFFREKQLTPAYGKEYTFSQIQDAIRAQDAGTVDGKIVVTG